MRKLLSIISLAALIIGCKEEPPFINYEEGTKLLDSTFTESPVVTAETKRIILEDVSGVKCVNCPDAAIIANSIINAFPGRVFTTVMHPNIQSLSTFVDPIDKEGYKSKYDFRTNDAKAILEARLGTPNSLPLGAIDRKMFSGKTSRLIGREEWYARADDQLKTTTPVNVILKSEFDEAKGEGVITVTLKYTKDLSENHFLTLSLIEDSLIDVQEYRDPQTFDVKFNPAYVHMHVLRDVITSATGDQINTASSSLTAGRVFIKQYRYKTNVSDKIKVVAKHAKILAMVHKDAQGIEVIQVNEVHVTEH